MGRQRAHPLQRIAIGQRHVDHDEIGREPAHAFDEIDAGVDMRDVGKARQGERLGERAGAPGSESMSRIFSDIAFAMPAAPAKVNRRETGGRVKK